MTVLHLTSCPPALRGDLTKWLMEIATGVYVGRISARVRDKLWERIVATCKGGRAILVFSTNNEQRMDFRIHGETWEPINFDGLKLMLRPNPARLIAKQVNQPDARLGFSDAAKYRKGRKYSKNAAPADSLNNDNHGKSSGGFYKSYVVVDVETTGLDSSCDEIIEVGAIKVLDGRIDAVFQSLIKNEVPVPPGITELNGITDTALVEYGRPLPIVLEDLGTFLSNMPIVAHYASFDMSFLNEAFTKCGLGQMTCPVVDTLTLAKKLHRNLISYRLKALAIHFNFDLPQLEGDKYRLHRSLGDCYFTHLLYEKLMNFGESRD